MNVTPTNIKSYICLTLAAQQYIVELDFPKEETTLYKILNKRKYYLLLLYMVVEILKNSVYFETLKIL